MAGETVDRKNEYIAVFDSGVGGISVLRQLRRELALCRRIQEDIPQVSRQVQQVREEKMRKEEPQHEYQRRNR